MGDDDMEIIYVTPVEIAAAKLLIKCNEKLGRDTDPVIVRLANAKPKRRRHV